MKISPYDSSPISVSEVYMKNMAKIDWHLTTTKHNKGWAMCIILGMYCRLVNEIKNITTHMTWMEDINHIFSIDDHLG